MNDDAKHFLDAWVTEHIRDEPYVRADAPDPRVTAFADRCDADARAAGLTPEQLQAAASDLHGAPSLQAFMALSIDLSAQKRHNRIAQSVG